MTVLPLELPVSITITLHENGRLEMSSPDNKMVACGILELAKIALVTQPQAPEASPIVVPRNNGRIKLN